MARNSPLLTLLAGGVFGAGLLVASMVATPDDTDLADDPMAGTSPSAPVTESPAPEPADTPKPDDTPEPPPEGSPEPEEPPEPVTYVGWTDDRAASVAIVITGDEAVAYVCDGISVEAWLDGSAADLQLDLTGDSASLTGSHDELRASGDTIVGELEWTFTIESVEPPEGLYRFADTISGGAEVVGGWIVLPDGSQVGLTNVNGETQPAAELDPATGQVEVEGELVTAERQG